MAHLPSMHIVELLAELQQRGAILDINDANHTWKIKYKSPRDLHILARHVRAWEQELSMILMSYRADGPWPLPPGEEGMCVHEAQVLIGTINADVANTPDALGNVYWWTDKGANDSCIIEVLYCNDRCFKDALTESYAKQCWDKCPGPRLRLHSLHAWYTRPKIWRQLVHTQ